MQETIRKYYLLTKPGIIYGNAVNAAAGFFLASRFHATLLSFCMMLFGISFSIASACVFNNYIDRGIDAKMERTKKRALVTHAISGKHALTFGTVLGIIGVFLLLIGTNLVTVFVMFVGFVFYIILYGMGKRQSVNGTLIGAVSGAVPPVVGYTTVTNHLDIGAFLLFLILVAWQMPHFYAIAIYRLKDYKSAGIPVMPAVKGIQVTKIHMLVYLIIFLITTSLLTVFKYTGYIYLAVMLVVGSLWLFVGIKGFWAKETEKWAKKMFFLSLIITIVFAVMISIGGILP